MNSYVTAIKAGIFAAALSIFSVYSTPFELMLAVKDLNVTKVHTLLQTTNHLSLDDQKHILDLINTIIDEEKKNTPVKETLYAIGQTLVGVAATAIALRYAYKALQTHQEHCMDKADSWWTLISRLVRGFDAKVTRELTATDVVPHVPLAIASGALATFGITQATSGIKKLVLPLSSRHTKALIIKSLIGEVSQA